MITKNHSTDLNLAASARRYRVLSCLTKGVFALILWIMGAGIAAPPCLAQTASTGALGGTVTDPTGTVVPNVQIKVTNEATGETRTVTSRSDGAYVVPLLPPGSYRVEAEGQGFKRGTSSGVRIEVTETTTLEIKLEVGAASELVTVKADAASVQTESSALGRVTDQKTIVSLPLATRNYTEILGLSPGVTAKVPNVSELGRGSGAVDTSAIAFGGSGTYVHGVLTFDNNFQMDGATINDLMGNVSGFPGSGGFAIPNPDTIQGFKVQTGLYDASSGRNGGANVNVVTRSGGNEFHGTLFEFFRNEALNANDFFFNRIGREREVLRQNQYGFTLGGPVKKDRLLFFTSYQGTRQANGVVLGGRSDVVGPPLTNDRSAAAIGSLFAGRRGSAGGMAILPDGSNINPISLRLLQMKLPDGSFLIPTPLIDPSRPFQLQGRAAFNDPSSFAENQYMGNLDYLHTTRSKFEGRFFSASGDQIRPLPPPTGATPGSPLHFLTEFRNFTLAHTFIFGANLINEARFGFYRIVKHQLQKPIFKFSDVGIAAPPGFDDLPNIDLSGGGTYRIGGGQDTQFVQNHYSLQDSLTYVHGSHVLRFGGGITRSEINIPSFRSNATITFNGFVDFLLGLSAAQNGSSASNIAGTNYVPGLRERAWRVREGFAYLQDDFKVARRLNFNLGLRYERIGHFAEAHGLDANFNFALANPNAPATGSLEGFVVPSNFPGAVPAGATRLDGDLSINGAGRNALEPRVGFAWQILPQSSRLALRGGYGIYHSRLTGQTPFLLVSQQPFSTNRNSAGITNPGATFSNPFPQPLLSAGDFPLFTTPYSPATTLTVHALAPDYRPSIVQQYGLNIQSEIARDFLLEVGYVGTRGTHLLYTRSLNQALLASPEHPIRGVTTNTAANIPQRVPVRGFAAGGIVQVETSGYSWYNGLEASLTKRFSRGLQLQAFYSFSKALATAGGNVESNSAGEDIVLGNQNDREGSYGRAIFDRTHRFVLNYVYEFPFPSTRKGLFGKVLGGWGLAGVTVIQSGAALTLTAQNVNNIFGITADRAQLAPGCAYADLVTPGSVSQRVDEYFNRDCLRVGQGIGGGQRGTTFGNSGVGIIDGPGQNNFDIALFKRTPVGWPFERSDIEFRAEFFNAFNHPQFSNPNLSAGNIASTSVSPRVMQFALKFHF